MEVKDYLSRQLTYLNGILNTSDRPDLTTRYIGGQTRTNQPFISGYHQVLFSLPPTLFTGANNFSEYTKWLTSTCEGFTPHSTTTNFIDVNGIGQLGSSFPASRTINREFTLTFREYQKLPIMKIFRAWAGLFDPHLGITTMSGGNFIPSNYKGYIMVGILSPTADNTDKREITKDDVEDVYLYEGVFPSSVPEDTVTASDQATNDSIQESVTFKFDGAPLDSSVDGLVEEFVTLLSGAAYGTTFERLASLGNKTISVT